MEPQYAKFKERFGQFIPRQQMDVKMVTGVDLRNTVQRWSNIAAAGADSRKRCDWKQLSDSMSDQVAESLRNIEEMTCETSYKELIDTPIWPEDVQTTPVSNIKKESETKECAPHHPCRVDAKEKAWRGQSTRGFTRMFIGDMTGANVQNAIWRLL